MKKKDLKNNMRKNQDKKEVLDLGNKTLWLIRLATLIVGLLFAKYVVFSPFTEMLKKQVDSLSYLLILKFMLIFLFNSRLYGLFMDLKEMKREFIKIKSKNFPWQGYFLLIILTLSFSSMIIYHSKNYTLFIALYLLFWFIDIFFWKIFKPFIKGSITETFKTNRDDEIEKLQNRVFWIYFNSNWMNDARNWAISFIILVLILVESKFETSIQNYLGLNSEHLITSLILFLSVLLTETIAWTKRLKRKYQIRYLEQNYEKIKRTIANIV